MLTAIEIENFKAFGERQRIELRPITLLFGPNSGGKSSVTHALHYLREVLCEGNLDAHRTWSGGESLDLGGIRTFVHGRTEGRDITIKTDFNLDGIELPDYSGRHPEVANAYRDCEGVIRSVITKASVELVIATSGTPRLFEVRVAINDCSFATYSLPSQHPHAEVRAINWQHPCVVDADGASILAVAFAQSREGSDTLPSVIQVPRPSREVPDFNCCLDDPLRPARDTWASGEFQELLSMLLFGPVALLRSRLQHFRYVGPLRSMPPRQFEPPDHSGRSRWPAGLQAWELLAHGQKITPAHAAGEGTLLDEVSKWLASEERLDTGYRLELEISKQVPANVAAMISDPAYIDRFEILAETIKALPEQTRVVLRDVGRNLRLQPQDVGVGLSQIVPVIVALLDPMSPLVALEQPELHLHPRQQAALGDALIKGMTATPNRLLLVETHSEHLILRVLRRIRETTRKQVLSGQSLTPDQLRIQYVRREGSVSRAQTIDVDVNGDLVDPWPDDFFEQDFKERFS